MRIFLDENVPRELVPDFRAGGHEVIHVEDVGLKGVSGTADVLVTADTNLGFQQHLARYNVAVVLLQPRLKTVQRLRALVPEALAAIPTAPKHRVTTVRPTHR